MDKLKLNINGKGGQEELVGFAIIVVIVTVVLLFFLVFSLRSNNNTQNVQNYELDSFLQSVSQYTTDCQRQNGNNMSLQDLEFSCVDSGKCSDDRSSCDVLDSSLKDIMDKSWPVGQDRPVKGYEIAIIGNQRTIENLTKGNITTDYQGALQDLSKAGSSVQMTLKIYY